MEPEARYFRALLVLSRLLGVGAAATYVVLYLVLLSIGYGSWGFDWMTYAMGVYMISLALLDAWSSLKLAPLLLLVVFIASFLLPPVGLYFLLAPGFMFWAGFCNLLYVAAATIMLVGMLGLYSSRRIA